MTASRAFFGPPRTRAESVLGAAGGVLVTALLLAYIRHAGGWAQWSVVQILVLAITGADLIGGIFTISTDTASRWYHRPGRDARRFRIGFVIAHAVAYLVPAAVVFDLGWRWAVANTVLVLGAAVAIACAVVDVKRMVALCLTLAASLVNLIWLPIPTALAWLPILLFVKILLCFSLPGAETTTRMAAISL